MKKILTMLISLAMYCVIFVPTDATAQYLQPLSKLDQKNEQINALIEKAKKYKSVPIIVKLNLVTFPEGNLSENQKINQRDFIKTSQNQLISQLAGRNFKVKSQYKYIPFVALRVNEETLKFLQSSPLVSHIEEDVLSKPMLAQSRNIVGANAAETMGYTGDGQVIAVIDTGVDKTHSFLAGKVISEACYSGDIFINDELTEYESLCPGEVAATTATGSGVPYSGTGSDHGTHVAGIAAGKGTSFSGIAKDADLVAIQVFTRVISTIDDPECEEFLEEECGTTELISYWAFNSDIIEGLERVYTLKTSTIPTLSSVNISIGSGGFSSACDTTFSSFTTAIENLNTVKVATVISSGNNNFTNKLSQPACISNSVSVGGTNDGSGTATPINAIWTFGNFGTNSASFLDLLAPAAVINSSVPFPSNSFADKQGTSMAAPHVAGAWAIIKERFPNATVDQILGALDFTGTKITDSRSGANGRQKPRINIAAAITRLEQTLPNNNTKFDFDGDGKTDASVFRPSENKWYINNIAVIPFGFSTDKLVPADFSGDGKTDIAVWRESNTNWYYIDSATNTVTNYQFGSSGDIPITGDFDGDGKADATIYRPSTGIWYVRKPDGSANVTQFGIAEDKPVVEDYDGDGKDDIAVFRPSSKVWHLNRSQAGYTSINFGSSNDKTVQGDYTGDGKADLAMWRKSNGTWHIFSIHDSSYTVTPHGATNDIPVPGDYDGDGTNDFAVYTSNGIWDILGQTNINYGLSTDIPLPSVYNVSVP